MATVTMLPSAAAQPVQQPLRRGRRPKSDTVVSINAAARLARRQAVQAVQQLADQHRQQELSEEYRRGYAEGRKDTMLDVADQLMAFVLQVKPRI